MSKVASHHPTGVVEKKLDWYARSIVSWALDQTMEVGLVLEAVEVALQ